MEAMEGLEEMGDLSSRSVKAVAKLADSDQVILIVANTYASYVWEVFLVNNLHQSIFSRCLKS